jgi:hypothetical protein
MFPILQSLEQSFISCKLPKINSYLQIINRYKPPSISSVYKLAELVRSAVCCVNICDICGWVGSWGTQGVVQLGLEQNIMVYNVLIN